MTGQRLRNLPLITVCVVYADLLKWKLFKKNNKNNPSFAAFSLHLSVFHSLLFLFLPISLSLSLSPSLSPFISNSLYLSSNPSLPLFALSFYQPLLLSLLLSLSHSPSLYPSISPSRCPSIYLSFSLSLPRSPLPTLSGVSFTNRLINN